MYSRKVRPDVGLYLGPGTLIDFEDESCSLSAINQVVDQESLFQ